MNIEIDDQDHVKQSVCQFLSNNSQGDFPEIKPGNIVSLRIINDKIVVMANCGIKGIPRFTIPADRLEFNPKPAFEVKFPDTLGSDKVISTKLAPLTDKPKTTNGRRKRGANK